MCFSNLPIGFDDEGNPFLAEDVDAIDRPPGSRRDRTGSASSVAPDEANPEAVYVAILETMPNDVRERLDGEAELYGEIGLDESVESD
jgi:hypothetical protein